MLLFFAVYLIMKNQSPKFTFFYNVNLGLENLEILAKKTYKGVPLIAYQNFSHY